MKWLGDLGEREGEKPWMLKNDCISKMGKTLALTQKIAKHLHTRVQSFKAWDYLGISTHEWQNFTKHMLLGCA